MAGAMPETLFGHTFEVASEMKRGYVPEGAKRRYEPHFVSKLTDCDGLRLGEPTFDIQFETGAYGSERENAETDSSLDFARDCRYIADGNHKELTAMNRSVGKMLGSMLKNPGPFLIPGSVR